MHTLGPTAWRWARCKGLPHAAPAAACARACMCGGACVGARLAFAAICAWREATLSLSAPSSASSSRSRSSSETSAACGPEAAAARVGGGGGGGGSKVCRGRDSGADHRPVLPRRRPSPWGTRIPQRRLLTHVFGVEKEQRLHLGPGPDLLHRNPPSSPG
jgi:hypothetical protein